MRVSMVILAMTVVVGPAALAQAPAAPGAEKKICRLTPPATGSMMPGKRICHTAAEWVAIDQATGDATNRFIQDRDRQGRMVGTSRN